MGFKVKRTKPFAFAVSLMIPLLAWAAATTITSSGNWSNSGIWDSGNIADNVSEDVDFNGNIGEVTIQDTESYTTSDIAMNNGNTLTINAGGALNVGNTGDGFKLATGNGTTINVHGDLTIWGDLDVGNDLVLVVTGNLVIKGDIIMGNGAGLTIDGNADVDGDFIAGNNANLVVDGALDVAGDFTAGNGSDMSGSGTVTSGGGCTGPPEFCTESPLPITLSHFDLKTSNSSIILNWTTSSEENFDYFEVQRAGGDGKFDIIETVKGNGYTTESIEYSWSDENPRLGINYYRLESVDFDGYRETFPAKYVLFEPEKHKVAIIPSQVFDSKIKLTHTFGERFALSLYNLSGHLLYTQISTDNQIQLPNLEPGVYLTHYELNGIQRTEKIIVH